MVGQTKGISIPEPDIRKLGVVILGTSSLISNKFSEKAKKQMRDKQGKKAKTARKVRKPKEEYIGSYYRTKDKKIAFPALCIKQSIVGAARFIDDLPMTVLRGSIFVEGDQDGLIPVKYESEEMREDMVRLARGATDFRYRGELKGWGMDFTIKYNAGVISAEQVLNLLNTAGFSQGIGEWRPERNGDHGTFKVKKSVNMEA